MRPRHPHPLPKGGRVLTSIAWCPRLPGTMVGYTRGGQHVLASINSMACAALRPGAAGLPQRQRLCAAAPKRVLLVFLSVDASL